GYANFAVDEPPLKLVLIEGVGEAGTLNHLGIEVADTETVGRTGQRLSSEGVATASEDQVECCFALQDKVWGGGPGGEACEIYTVLADVEMPGESVRGAVSDAMFCATAAESAARCC